VRPTAITFRRTFVILLTTLAWLSAHAVAAQDSATPQGSQQAGLAAWQQVYSVLTHPRCMNCHTATDYPEQGDDRHRHLFNVVRGPGGKGVPGLNCATCHQGANADSTGVPGAQNWHLAPLSMKWQDTNDKILPSADICRSVSGHSKEAGGVLRHHQQEALVLWAFQPGRRRDGSERSVPPLSHEQFVAATRTWVEAGMPCPSNP